MDQERRIRDHWLALRCQADEPGAREQLVEEMQAPLLYYALKICGNFETAREVLQDSWIRAIPRLHRLTEPAAIRPWLYRIVQGIAVDRVRRDVVRERSEDALIIDAAETSDDWIERQNAEAVHAALDRVSARHREVLVLFFLESFSIAEIAAIIETPEGTVKSRLHHGKTAMRNLLTHS